MHLAMTVPFCQSDLVKRANKGEGGTEQNESAFGFPKTQAISLQCDAFGLFLLCVISQLTTNSHRLRSGRNSETRNCLCSAHPRAKKVLPRLPAATARSLSERGHYAIREWEFPLASATQRHSRPYPFMRRSRSPMRVRDGRF